MRPEPIELGAGEAYRLGFMHTSPDDHKHVEPLAGEEPGERRRSSRCAADGGRRHRSTGGCMDGPAQPWVGMGGGNAGVLRHYINDRLTIVVLTNLMGAEPEGLAGRVAEIIR